LLFHLPAVAVNSDFVTSTFLAAAAAHTFVPPDLWWFYAKVVRCTAVTNMIQLGTVTPCG